MLSEGDGGYILKKFKLNKNQELKKEKTHTVTYRLPERIVHELETESRNKKISQNVLVKQILEKMGRMSLLKVTFSGMRLSRF